ncbi:MAG: type II secretion system F family protein [Armatimonadota bacterium]|nr:type II secretion system F family protein [Armatimonadota bacterium]
MFGAAQARVRSEAYGELASMLHAGVTIGESATAVAEEMRPSPLRDALLEAGHKAAHGSSLAEAMRGRPTVFSPLTVAMVEVGERAGRLEESLQLIADYYEQDFELRHLLTRELAYPIVLFAGIIFIPLIGQFILIWITATLAEAVVTAAVRLLLILLVVGVPLGIILLIMHQASQSEQGRLALDRAKLRIPIIGGVVRKLAVARFCRALASLYSSGVMMGTSVELAGEAAGNEAVRRELQPAVRKLEEGQRLSEALSESSLMPSTVLTMLKTGERTGDIDGMAQNVANHLQREAETSVKQLAVTLAPIAVIIAGVIVALMLLSFYTGYAGTVMQ